MTDLATNAPPHGYSGEHELGAIERVVALGDLSKLGPEERARYLFEVCRSLGLNPLTLPFQYLLLNGKLVLYATRGATDQLRRVHHVSTTILSREAVGDVYVVTARATDRAGRSDESIGAVPIGGLKGEALCNALMKAESKAKRRATLALVGLGMLDESEVDTIPGARRLDPDAVLHEEPPPVGVLSPRMQAVADEIDAALAEGEQAAQSALAAQLRTSEEKDAIAERQRQAGNPLYLPDEPAPTGELPGPRWGTLPIGRSVSAMVDALLTLPEGDSGRRFVLPANEATDAEVRQWLESKKRLLEARRQQR